MKHDLSRLPPGWELFNESYTAAWPFRDVEGRPIGEGSAPDECLADVPTEWRECPYAGSRNRHARRMNVSALRQVTVSWEQVLVGARWLKREYIARFAPSRFDAIDLWRVTKFATTLPAYLRCRRERPLADGELPVVVTAMYKVLAGVFQTVQHRRLFTLAAGESVAESPSLEELTRYAESNGLFVGRTGVCSGPPHLIREILGAVLDPPPEPRGPNVVAEILGDPEPFFRYAVADSTLQMRKFTFHLGWQSMVYRLHQHVAREAPRAVHEALGEGLARMRESSFLPIPDALLSEEGTDARAAIVRDVSDDVAQLDRWLVARAPRPLLSSAEAPLTPRRETRDAHTTAPGATFPPATRSAMGATMTEYLDQEREALPELCARQRLIDRLLERSSDEWAADVARIRASLGVTPRDVIAPLLLG